MGWLPLYATLEDLDGVRQWLNAETEIAFIVSAGPGRWIARPEVDAFQVPTTCLWHVPSGPLPLEVDATGAPRLFVDNPWEGWQERRAGADPSLPYFGPGHPGVIWLNVLPSSKRVEGALGLSSFGWIGNHYRILGSAAHPSTVRWWQRLRRWIKKNGVLVPRGGLSSTMPAEIWALPHARDRLLGGAGADVNPYW